MKRVGWGVAAVVSALAIWLTIAGCQGGSTAPTPTAAPRAAPTAIARSGAVATPRGASPAATAPEPGSAAAPVITGAAPLAPKMAPGAVLFAKFGGFWRIDMDSGVVADVWRSRPNLYAGAPAVSPDGKLIAFSTYDAARMSNPPDPGTDLNLMNIDGSSQRVVLPHDERGVWLSEPTWLPDGGGFLFTRRDAKGVERIERFLIQSGERKVVIENAAAPALSADGTQLLFLRTDPQSYAQDLWIAQADGTGARRLVGEPDFAGLARPRFAPDGKRLAVVGIGGPQRPAIERKSGARRLPGWPGPRVASAHGVPYHVWTMNTDGTDLRRLTNELEVESAVIAWSPDGKWILFPGDAGLYMVDAVDARQVVHVSRELVTGGFDWYTR